MDPTLGATGDQPPDGPPHGAVARPALLRLSAGRDDGRSPRAIAGHPSVNGTVPTGLLFGFTSNDPAAACRAAEPSLQVWTVSGHTNEFLVAAPPSLATA